MQTFPLTILKSLKLIARSGARGRKLRMAYLEIRWSGQRQVTRVIIPVMAAEEIYPICYRASSVISAGIESSHISWLVRAYTYS